MNAIALLMLMDSAGHELSGLFLAIIWESAIIFLAATVIVFLLRKKNPSVRFVIWTAAFMVLPFIPYFSDSLAILGGPQMKIPVSLEQPSRNPESVQFPNIRAVSADAVKPSHAETDTKQATPDNVKSDTHIYWLHDTALLLAYLVKLYPYAFGFMLYMSGLVFLLARTFVGKFRIGQWIKKSDVVYDRRITGIFKDASKRLGLGHHVILIESAEVSCPLTCRTFRPVVVLPTSFADALNDDELLSVALHELSHIRRNDVAVLSVLSVLRAFLFFNPFVWMILYRIQYLAEISCDILVLEQTHKRAMYAGTLLRIAETVVGNEKKPEMALAFSPARRPFARRIREILTRPLGRNLSKSDYAAITILAMIALFLALAFPLGFVQTGSLNKYSANWPPEAVPEKLYNNSAYAYPVNGIVIDGDLSDWPEDMASHKILNFDRAYGPTDLDDEDLSNSSDCSAKFRAGYNTEEGLLYFAIEVTDDIVFTFTNQESRNIRDYPDACELYLDGLHTRKTNYNWDAGTLPVNQYVMAANNGIYSAYTLTEDYLLNPNMVAGTISMTRTKADYARHGDTTIYEWAVEVFDEYPHITTELTPGKTIGFDIAIDDRDNLESNTSWGCFGPFTALKISDSGKLGDLILVENSAELGTLSGRVTNSSTGEAVFKKQVYVFFNGDSYATSVTDREGRFSIPLLSGDYLVKASNEEGAIVKMAQVMAGQEISVDIVVDDPVEMAQAK